VASLVKRITIIGLLLLSILYTGLALAAHDDNKCVKQEIEHQQNCETQEQECLENNNDSAKTDTAEKKNCCKKNEESN